VNFTPNSIAFASLAEGLVGTVDADQILHGHDPVPEPLLVVKVASPEVESTFDEFRDRTW
jgi:hypothetical protein